MKNKIDWNKEGWWNELNLYDEYFLSFNYDHCGVDEDLWKELVKKWKLNTKVTKCQHGGFSNVSQGYWLY